MDKKSISYSILDLAIVPKGSTTKQTIENAVFLAQRAEEFGYKRIWFAEHHNSAAIASSAPQILIGRVAQETQNIRVGSGGIMLPNHSLLIISEQFGTLGTMYPGRIDLGLGRAPGTDQETAHAIKPGFYQATQSFPADIDQIQNYFSLQNRSSKVRAPIAEGVDVPLYILGSSTDSAHLAAKKGLPYAFASHFATSHLMNALGIYKAEFKASQVLESPYAIAGINVFVADTDEEAQIMATSFYKMIIGLLTGNRGDHLEEASELSPDLMEMIQHPAVQQMVKYSFIGCKETVKTQIKSFMDMTKVDELIVTTNCHNQVARIKSYMLFAEIINELNVAMQKSK